VIAPAAPPPAIVQPADRFELLRCRCPRCLRLDARFPGQGFQLALFPYVVPPRPSTVVVRLEEARARRTARLAK
jgi:hypothetical protein